MHYNKLALLTVNLLLVSLSAEAAPTKYRFVAPNCLLTAIHATTLATSNSLALIETDANGLQALITAKDAHRKEPCGGFIDVTHDWQSKTSAKEYLNQFVTDKTKTKAATKTDYQIRYPEKVNQMLKLLDSEAMWNDLAQFTNTNKDQFPDRYANSDTGVKAATWLKNKVEALAKFNHRDDVTVYTVATGNSYKQPSVVAKIGHSNQGGIVIGGHMDTLSSSWELKPGADDDGSGSMTVMGIARTLITSGMHFKKPIYIIWYAAEEMGLVGSSYVVKDFNNKKIPIDAALQFDMTGYAHKNNPTMWFITDNIDNELTNYVKELATTYVKQPVDTTRCGYACSDHASWHNAGIKAVFPFEGKFGKEDPYIHTSEDKMEVLSLAHMTNFAKLGLAFAVELGEPTA